MAHNQYSNTVVPDLVEPCKKVFIGEIADRAYEQITIGSMASYSKTIAEDDVITFAHLCGDFNPIHLDSDFASRTTFRRRIVHGMLINSLISTVLGTKLPGANTIYISQNSKFLAPAFIGDVLTATVEVIEKRDEKHIIIFKTIVTNQFENQLTVGEAIVKKM